MIRIVLVVAAALLISLKGSAKAADDSDHLNANTQKVLASLNMIGINSKEVKDFVAETDAHMDSRHSLALISNSALGGQWSLRYDATSILPSARQFEVRYNLSNTNVAMVARTNNVGITYRIEF